ncbi:MAG: TonB-dependent receptor [Bacteroides uniformis]|nr:TonB-dependent receptor [Bacteroides uniformis]
MRKTFLEKCINLHLCRVALVLLFFVPAISSLQANPSQNRPITGVVTSATDSEPLIGVSVQVKETATGGITDIDGKYSVAAQEGQTLIFSYIGYKSQEIKVGASAVINVILKEDTEMLDEVVVVGYGVQKKKLVTGATVQVKGDNIAKLNTNNPLQAMQGQTPGVNIASTSGQPGADMKVTIRGLGTVGNSQPLYLIDGVGGDISTLNPADIESIDVLKDAASAAIYGAQAANGVVLITTKQGKEGKAQISFDAYYGIQNVPRTANMLNAEQYMVIMNEQAVNSGNAPYDWSQIKSIYDANGNVYDSNWVDAMFKDNATTESYSLGVTGGSATSTYALSLGYLNQEGIVGGSDVSNYTRYNFRINSEHKLFKDLLTVGEQVSFVYKKNNGVGVGNQYNNTLRGAFGTSPITPIYSDNNNYDSPYNDTTNSDWYKGDGNPYGAMMTNTNNENKNATFSGNVYAELRPIKNLKIRTTFGAVYGSSEYRSFKPLYRFSIYDYNETRTSVSQNMNHSLGMTWTNTATYDWKIKDHAFNALIGMEAYRYEGTYLSGGNGALKEGFDDWEHAYVSNGTASSSTDGLSASGNPHDEGRSVSYFARLGWNWKETYMINATLRSDGSSKFASGNRFGHFPSVSAGWTISNEKFMESTQGWLDFLKIRASWGQVGNQNIKNYQYLAPIKNTNTHYLFGSGFSDAGAAAQLATNWGAFPSRLSNPNLTWETSEQTNIGLDARFLDSRLGFNFDFYIKNTKDWLVEAPILATAGAGAPYINGGSVKNTGVELALTWDDTIGKDFRYNVGINGAYNKNKVGKIPTEDGIIHGSTNQLYDNTPEFYRAENGKPIGYFWGYKTAGIFQNNQEIKDWIAADNGILQSNVQPGDVRYVDVNHDGVINDEDKVNLGDGMPDFTLGLNLGFNYKNFDFSVVANGAFGHQIVQSYRMHANKYANYTTAILERWTGEGTSNRIPRVTEQNINWQFSDLFIQDGDYLRISNITIGYDFAKLIRCKAISQARIYAQVQNAITFTKYDGMDPEIGFGPEGDNGLGWASGVDVGYYPRPRTILFGVNLKF